MDNDMQTLCTRVRSELPELENGINIPQDSAGVWFLDILRPHSTTLVVQWKPEKNFGLSSTNPGMGYGEVCVEIYTTVDQVFERIKELVKSGESTYSFCELLYRYKNIKNERDRLLFVLCDIFREFTDENHNVILKYLRKRISRINTKNSDYLDFLIALGGKTYFK